MRQLHRRWLRQMFIFIVTSLLIWSGVNVRDLNIATQLPSDPNMAVFDAFFIMSFDMHWCIVVVACETDCVHANDDRFHRSRRNECDFLKVEVHRLRTFAVLCCVRERARAHMCHCSWHLSVIREPISGKHTISNIQVTFRATSLALFVCNLWTVFLCRWFFFALVGFSGCCRLCDLIYCTCNCVWADDSFIYVGAFVWHDDDEIRRRVYHKRICRSAMCDWFNWFIDNNWHYKWFPVIACSYFLYSNPPLSALLLLVDLFAQTWWFARVCAWSGVRWPLYVLLLTIHCIRTVSNSLLKCTQWILIGLNSQSIKWPEIVFIVFHIPIEFQFSRT